ncbi:MAG: sigma-70 family RNA polymerase sigma factor [Bacteroidales bacterium]|nr:sigma-70 family RNA polymerase sigma factor [Bacteroidales bacterium]
MEYVSDEIYIKRVLGGDGRAFSCLVERHKAMVFTISLRITGHQEEAEEVAQDVFLKMYQALHTFKGSSKFSTWLYSIAYNMAISHVRKSRPDYIPLSDVEYKTADEHNEAMIFTDESDDNQRRIALSHALNNLKQDELLLINMYYTEQMSIEQISAITKLSASNVKVKLFRIRQKLSNEIINKNRNI